MSDIFQEVEEEVRREKLRALWDKYGGLVLALAVAIVIGVAGWRGWEWWQHRQAEAAGVRFEAALRLAAEGKTAESEAALASLQAEGPGGYALLARLTRADVLSATDRAAAVAAYDAIAADTGAPALIRDLAQVRAGLLLIDGAPYADMKSRLEPLAAAEGAYRHTARELLAASAWKAGERPEATKWTDRLLSDPQASSSLRLRGEILRELLSSAGAPKAAKAEPAKAEPAKTEPAKTEPAKAN
ncbi:tetratricopeptide repeat protein [Blastochloris tepida]|jgi:hypothetical protein|uniref:Membrane protein n=1 Tax=Blastochloris tepida TaxID=2233851 RepID=A0A348G3P0_9HYPH|nr:tetratricopeptide repeat protein [Blastochloris tepida]BBF94173.1 membrane protein [Blastochloris tepida]